MYAKNLTEDFRLRLSVADMDFLKSLSEERGCTISECVRSLIGEYRRGLDTMRIMRETLDLAKERGLMFNGDTKSDIDH